MSKIDKNKKKIIYNISDNLDVYILHYDIL